MRHVGGICMGWSRGLSECVGERTLGSPLPPVRPSCMTTHSAPAGLRGPLRCHTPLPEQRVHSVTKRP